MVTMARSLFVALAWCGQNAREILFVLGLLLTHVGLRAVEPWAPGLSWSLPGAVLTAIAIFGVRGGAPTRRKKE
jgi:hypothetical protein